jgi:hypothetical protein
MRRAILVLAAAAFLSAVAVSAKAYHWISPWYPYGLYGHPYMPYVMPYVMIPRPLVIQPPAYVQSQEFPSQYWYYCQDPQGYHPYISDCPGGWMKVVPQTVLSR